MFRWFATCGLALAWTTAASAADLRMDPDGFTQDVARQFQSADPDAVIAIKAPLAIDLTLPDKRVFQAGLQRIYDYCQRVPDDCASQVTLFVKSIREAGLQPPFDATMLRAVLRPKDYAAGAQTQIPGKPADFFLSRPFVGDLYEMCVVDRPNTANLVNADTLKTLDLDPAAAFARCEANLADTVPGAEADPAPGKAQVAGDDYYESSLLLRHEAWAAMAARFGGALLVAAPDPGMIVYAHGDDAGTLQIMQAAVQEGLHLSQRPLSAEVLRWTKSGWEVAAP